MWFRRRSEWERLGLVQRGHPVEPSPLKTSVGWFDLHYGPVHPDPPLYVRVLEYREDRAPYAENPDDWDDDHWDAHVANISDLTKLFVWVGIPDDEAELAARDRYGEVVRYVREGWPDFELRVDEPPST
jgi:hypothetical protein